MSRCFPFPPPGYEKKLRVEDVTLLAKEKDKEKKHKKDKEKDKKEGKVKNKERKDKEKHRHKDKDKKNDKKRSRDEKTIDGTRPNVEKVGSNSPENSCTLELEKRINFVDGATRSQTVRTIYGRDDGKDKPFDGVASRSNGAEVGFDQISNGQRDNFPSKFPKIVFSNGPMENKNINTSNEGKDMQRHNRSFKSTETFGLNGVQFVEEIDRRVKVENEATGSLSRGKVNVTIQKRGENLNSGKLPNGNVLSFSQVKENPKFGNFDKAPKVAIVHNTKTELRGCEREAAGDVGTSKNYPLEGSERSRYAGKTEVGGGDRVKIQPKEEDRNKPRKAERLKEEPGNIVELARIGHNGNDSTDSNKQFTFKLSNKNSEVITGKRKEPEANEIHGNESRPSKFQRTIVSPENGRNFADGDRVKPVGHTPGKLQRNIVSPQLTTESVRNSPSIITLPSSKQVPTGDGEEHQLNCRVKPMGPTTGNGNETRPSKMQRTLVATQPSMEYGRNSKTTTNTMLTSKQDGDEYKSNWTVRAQSPIGPTSSQLPFESSRPCTSASAKPMVSPIPGQSPLRSTKANGAIGAHRSPSGPTKPPLSVGTVHGKAGSQGLNLGPTKPPFKPPIKAEDMKKPPERVGHLESVKPPLAPGEVNGTIVTHESKPSSSSKKEKRKHKSSSKPKPLSPHPDTKYLSQILSVPKMEELSEFDDQSWLFETKSRSSKELDNEDEQVWAKAVHIKSPDIYALPYVIPY